MEHQCQGCGAPEKPGASVCEYCRRPAPRRVGDVLFGGYVPLFDTPAVRVEQPKQHEEITP